MSGNKQGASAQSPPPLTGGTGDTPKKEKRRFSALSRQLPAVALSTVQDHEFKLLAQGWDTVAETFDLVIPELLQEQLEAARVEAEDLNDGEAAPHLITFGGEQIQINSRRPKRGRWSLANDDFQITFRSPKMDWCVTVRYSAGGLWEYGLDTLRDRVLAMLKSETLPKSKDFTRISEAHWCWDFHSEKFTAEMEPGLMAAVVCHSSTKKTNTGKAPEIQIDEWGRAGYLETLTIGSRKSALQIQVYDKGKEITEASSKTWMLALWAKEGFTVKDPGRISDVWRLEIRMKKDFLRGRGICRIEEMRADLPGLLAEALFTRRLTAPTDDQNRARWPLHPLWTVAYQATSQAAEMMPLGRQLTQAGAAIRSQMVKNMAGLVRAAVVLEVGDYDAGNAEAMIREVINTINTDPQHSQKITRNLEKYRYVNTAKG